MIAFQLLHSQGAIKYEQDELPACKSLVDQCLSDDPDTIISYASIAFKEQGRIHVLLVIAHWPLAVSRANTPSTFIVALGDNGLLRAGFYRLGENQT